MESSQQKSPWKGEASAVTHHQRQTSTILHSVPMDSAQRIPEPCWQGSHASRKPIALHRADGPRFYSVTKLVLEEYFSKCISTVKLFAVPFGSMSTEVYAFNHLLQSNTSSIKEVKTDQVSGQQPIRLSRTAGLGSFNKTILVPPNIRLPSRISD